MRMNLNATSNNLKELETSTKIDAGMNNKLFEHRAHKSIFPFFNFYELSPHSSSSSSRHSRNWTVLIDLL